MHATRKCGQPLLPRSGSGTEQAQYIYIYISVFVYASCMHAAWKCGQPILPRSGSGTEPRSPLFFFAATQRCDNSSYDTFGPRGPAPGGGELRPDFWRTAGCAPVQPTVHVSGPSKSGQDASNHPKTWWAQCASAALPTPRRRSAFRCRRARRRGRQQSA